MFEDSLIHQITDHPGVFAIRNKIYLTTDIIPSGENTGGREFLVMKHYK